MPRFKVKQLHICHAIYEVEAADPIEAAHLVIYGDSGDPVYDLSDLSPALEMGMPEEDLKPYVTEVNKDMYNAIRDENEFINSIDSVEVLSTS